MAMCTPEFITWIRKAGYVYTWLHHMDQEGWLCVHLASSHGSGRLAMCTPDCITWIMKYGYVYT